MGDIQRVMEGAYMASTGISLGARVCERRAQEGATEHLTRLN